MEKDVKELVKVIQKHDMECDAIPVSTCNQDCDGCLARDILKSGYILPSSEMKLIGDEEIEKTWMDALAKNPHWEVDAIGLYGVVAQAQLLADQKAHAGMTKELIDALKSIREWLLFDKELTTKKDGEFFNEQFVKANNLANKVLARYGG